MIMPVALLLVKLVLLDRMVSMYRVCRWFGYLLLSVFWVLEYFSLRPRQLVHCPAFINKKQGEREFTWRQQRLLLFFLRNQQRLLQLPFQGSLLERPNTDSYYSRKVLDES